VIDVIKEKVGPARSARLNGCTAHRTRWCFSIAQRTCPTRPLSSASLERGSARLAGPSRRPVARALPSLARTDATDALQPARAQLPARGVYPRAHLSACWRVTVWMHMHRASPSAHCPRVSSAGVSGYAGLAPAARRASARGRDPPPIVRNPPLAVHALTSMRLTRTRLRAHDRRARARAHGSRLVLRPSPRPRQLRPTLASLPSWEGVCAGLNGRAFLVGRGGL
jgi:hypothetical protein